MQIKSLLTRKRFTVIIYPLLSLVFFVVTFLLYFKLWRSYFTQDEWYYFGLFNQFVDKPTGFIDIFIQQFTRPKLYGIHFTPLWNSIFFLEYQLFGLTYQAYALLSMLLHGVTAATVAYLGVRLTRSYAVGILAGLYFTVMYSLYEGITWANTHLQVQVPSILVVFIITTWLKGLEGRKDKFFIISVILLFLGLLVKETIIGLFLLLPSLSYIYGKDWKRGIKYILATAVMYFPLRFLAPILLRQTDTSQEMASSLPMGLFDIGPHLFRIVFYPFKAVLHQFITPEVITMFSEQLAIWQYPALYGQGSKIRDDAFLHFVHSAGSDFVMLFLAIPCGIFLWWCYQILSRDKNKQLFRAFLLSLLFIVISVLPLIPLVPWLLTLFKYVTYIESRHFYLIGIGMSLLFSIILIKAFQTSKKLFKKKTVLSRIPLVLLILFTISFFMREVMLSRFNAQRVIQVGEERRIIVDYIKAVNPRITDKAVFYITSNMQYFGLPSLMVPFQTNFGYTLLNVYQPVMKYDTRFFTTNFLIEKGIDGQDYREINGKGFGYYIKGRDLLHALSTYDLTTENIYAFSYNGSSKIIQSTTEEVRTRILAEKAYEDTAQNWNIFTDKEKRISFKYPLEYTVTREDTTHQTSYKIVSLIDGRVNYLLTLFKDSYGKPLDDYALTLLPQAKTEHPVMSKETLYFSQLQRYNVDIAENDDKSSYFFYHPKSYYIIRLDVSKPVDSSYSLDQFLWSLQFN